MRQPRKPTETVGAGLQPLASLPVFLKLQGRRAVVAGDDAGSVWKARLLSAAGADTHLFAPDLDPALRPEPVAGPIHLHDRAWRPEDLDGAAFAIAGLPSDPECEAFLAEAARRGVPANAIDRPHLCAIQFGAVVNRSPLVVGISTDGAAPIFAQRIRTQIEGLLPQGFVGWMEAAARLRERVKAVFGAGPGRRTFWELFSERAFAQPDRPPSPEELDGLILAAQGSPAARGGSVALVGAGPGDPELLTLKALRALRSADVVLYDDLVAPEILGFVRREARTMLVGKTGHLPSCRQSEICELMVGLARQGRRVVRLKGGDPLIFARAAEEIEACEAAGIPVELVPAITAAQGAAAALGVPLTNRDGARRVQFVTAHDRNGALPDLDWGAIADPTATTAFYMAHRRLPEILARAMEAGLPAGTPAAAIQSATRPDQRIVRGTVADLPGRLAEEAGTGPLLLLVGDVVRASAARAGTAPLRAAV